MALFGNIELPGAPDLENVRRLDLMVLPQLRRMMRLGMAIDREYFWNLASEFSTERDQLEKDISSYVPPERLHEFAARSAAIEEEDGSASINAASSEQIGKLLFEIIGVGKDKKLKMTKAGDRLSTGKKQLELVRLEHPVVPLILRHRELDKLISTYCNKLPRIATLHPRGVSCPVCELPHDDDTWRVHGTFGTTRADTGRINHKNPNLGNIPTRTDDGQRVQAGFIAGKGKKLVARDLSQIELRGLAHLANCRSMLDVYLNDGDLHDDTARKVFGLPPDEKPDKIKHRMASKRTNFGVQNGTTEKGLYLQLVMDFGASGIAIPDWLTEQWCKWFIEQWLESRPEVQLYFDQRHYLARRYKMAWDLFGRVKLLPEVESTHSWIRDSGLRQAQNMPVTALAAGQFKLAMAQAEEGLLELNRAGIWCWPLVPIHDALMCESDERYASTVSDVIGYSMDGCMDDWETGELMFRLPIKSDDHVMDRWEK